MSDSVASVECFCCPEFPAQWPVYSVSIVPNDRLSGQCTVFYCPSVWFSGQFSVSVVLSVRSSGKCTVFLLSYVPGLVSSVKCVCCSKCLVQLCGQFNLLPNEHEDRFIFRVK